MKCPIYDFVIYGKSFYEIWQRQIEVIKIISIILELKISNFH